MSLEADTLLAVTGIFPSDVTDRHFRLAESMPERWAKWAKKWVNADEASPWEHEPFGGDMEKTFNDLSAAPLQGDIEAWFSVRPDDAQVVMDYVTGFYAARNYAIDIWPKVTRDTGSGPKIEPLSWDDEAEVSSVLRVLDDPDAVLAEMEQRTLTASQAQAMQVTDRPTVIDFLVEESEDCWPMIAPGKAHDEMLGTYETLKQAGGVPQHRRVDADEESKLSLG